MLKKDDKRCIVKDKQLAGKIIVLHFVSLVNGYNNWNSNTTDLVDIYNKLEPKGGFEVIFVAVRNAIPCQNTRESTLTYSTPHERFEERFSTMPWTAIPFSDLKSRKRLERKFCNSFYSDVDIWPISYVIDSRGYPFTKERLECLDTEDDVARISGSLETLLSSPESDYVITNKGEQVPGHKLEDKVVGLLLYTDIMNKSVTWKLKMVYEELSKKKVNFEVVLVYLLPTSSNTAEDAFWKTFEEMPWLAVPYKDTDSIKKLQRIFELPLCIRGLDPVSSLVIIDPLGKYVEPFGANIMMFHGVPAYPFTRHSPTKLKVENVKDLKPEMLWDRDAVFSLHDGFQVQFSQVVGKRIIVLFHYCFDTPEPTLRKLKALYMQMKGTTDEFEVIHMCEGGLPEDVAAAIPWLMHPPFDKTSSTRQVIHRVFDGCHFGLVAFDQDGRLVRRTRFPVIGNTVFPFYRRKDMEDEILMEVEDTFDMPLNAL
ncbi:putative nucleoredoxin 1 [Apium graveolens]|uniref:putative nucleoredoxin 1 n=1 Tax=Apium graveolens TaxID=4045 RepID=UPI003D79D60E